MFRRIRIMGLFYEIGCLVKKKRKTREKQEKNKTNKKKRDKNK